MKSCWIIPACERRAEPCKRNRQRLFLGPDNEVQRVLATGNVNAETTANRTPTRCAPAPMKAEMTCSTGKQNLLRTATLTGNVHVERIGSQPMQGDAGRAILDFLGQNQLQKVHAMDGVRLSQHSCEQRRDCGRFIGKFHGTPGLRHRRADHRLLCRRRKPLGPRHNFRGSEDHDHAGTELQRSRPRKLPASALSSPPAGSMRNLPRLPKAQAV